MNNIYKKGLDRKYQFYFLPSLDEYIAEDNIVRIIYFYMENSYFATIDNFMRF